MKEELQSFYAHGNWQLRHEIGSQPAPRGLDLNLPEALGSKSQPEAVLQSSGDAAGDEQVHSAGRRHCSLCGTLSPDCGLAAALHICLARCRGDGHMWQLVRALPGWEKILVMHHCSSGHPTEPAQGKVVGSFGDTRVGFGF